MTPQIDAAFADWQRFKINTRIVARRWLQALVEEGQDRPLIFPFNEKLAGFCNAVRVLADTDRAELLAAMEAS